MAYVDGESLAARLKRRGRLPPEEARRVMIETADALGAAHAVGIIHRDVKPDNILLEGSRGRVVVTDFGIAKALSSTTGPATLTATGVAIGTPHYMSPEQAAGDREIDGRSDLYSLGVVSYQTLTGELPGARRAARAAGRGRRGGNRAGCARQFRAVGLGEWVAAPGRCPHGPSCAQLVADGRGLHGRVQSRAALHQALACRLLLARRVVPASRTRRRRCPSRARRGSEAGRAPARHEWGVRAPDGRGPAGAQRPQGDPQDPRARTKVGEEAATGRAAHGGRAAAPCRGARSHAPYHERGCGPERAGAAGCEDRGDEAGAGGGGAGAAARPARAAAADAHRSRDAPPADRGSGRVVCAGDAERALRPASAPVSGSGGRAGRPHAGDATSAVPVTRRGPRDRRGGGDSRGAGREAQGLELPATAAAHHHGRALV